MTEVADGFDRTAEHTEYFGAPRSREVTFESRPSGGFFNAGMVRGGVLTAERWQSISGRWNETRYGYPNYHKAIDVIGNLGEHVYAVAAGTVSAVIPDDGDGINTTTPFGNTVVLDLDVGGTIATCHLHTIGVTLGERVEEGESLGTLGSTGNSSGPHTHIQCSWTAQGMDVLTKPWEAVDPVEFLQTVTERPEQPLRLPRLPLIVGQLPQPGAQALVVLSRACLAVEVVEEAHGRGCELVSLWLLNDGAWQGYIAGAPLAVNAHFPVLQASTGLLVKA